MSSELREGEISGGAVLGRKLLCGKRKRVGTLCEEKENSPKFK